MHTLAMLNTCRHHRHSKYRRESKTDQNGGMACQMLSVKSSYIWHLIQWQLTRLSTKSQLLRILLMTISLYSRYVYYQYFTKKARDCGRCLKAGGGGAWRVVKTLYSLLPFPLWQQSALPHTTKRPLKRLGQQTITSPVVKVVVCCRGLGQRCSMPGEAWRAS